MTISEGRRRPKKLSAETKWEIYLQVTGAEITQADAARKWGVDVSRVISIGRTVKDAALAGLARKPGRPATERNWELEAARAEIGQLTEAIKVQAIELAIVGENPAGTERTGPGESPRRGQRAGRQHRRRRRCRRVLAHMGHRCTAGLRGPGAPLAGPPTRAGHARRSRPGRRAGTCGGGRRSRGGPRCR